jgi:ABC-type spermidine/putrescine transport system permease subunit I
LAATRPWLRLHTRGTLALLLGPGVLLFCLFYLYPIARLLSLSVMKAGEGGQGVALTADHYAQVLRSPMYLPVLGETLRISALATVFALLLGYPVAYLLTRVTPSTVTRLMIFLLLPFWTSLLVRTYAWMVLLQRRGVVNSLLLQAGLIDKPVALMFNEVGVIIGTTHILLPFMIFPIYSALRRVDHDLVKAARGLGASDCHAFLRVTLPLSLPGVGAGVLIVFVSALGYFVTPALLGGGKVVVVAMAIERQVNDFLNWPLAGALAVVLVGVTLLAVGLFQRMLRLERVWT